MRNVKAILYLLDGLYTLWDPILYCVVGVPRTSDYGPVQEETDYPSTPSPFLSYLGPEPAV